MKRKIIFMLLLTMLGVLTACSRDKGQQEKNTYEESFTLEISETEPQTVWEKLLIQDFEEVQEGRHCLTVSSGGEVVYVSEEGWVCGSDTYIRRLEALCDSGIRQIILNENITVLGKDGRIYTEAEYHGADSYQGEWYNIGAVFLDYNENVDYTAVNSDSFPALDLMVLTDDGRVMGTDSASLSNCEAMELTMENNEKAVYLSGKYVLTQEGHVYRADYSDRSLKQLEGFENIVAIDSFDGECLALTNTGRVMLTHKDNFELAVEVFSWSNIVDVILGDGFCAGLKSDGTVVVYGNTVTEEQMGLSTADILGEWTDIKAIATDGYNYIAGLTRDNEIKLNYKREVPQFLRDISDEVYFEAFRVWDAYETNAISSYEGVDNPCELIIDGVLRKAVYSEDGIVIIQNERDCTLIYEGKELVVPVWLTLGAGYHNIIRQDYDEDGLEELVFYCNNKWEEWFYVIRLNTMEFININYSEETLEELFDYGINHVELNADGNAIVYFYIENSRGDRIEGNAVVYGGLAEAEYVIYPVAGMAQFASINVVNGGAWFYIGTKDASGEAAWITFNARIKYNPERGEFFPAAQNVRFDWMDSTLHLQSEYLEIE